MATYKVELVRYSSNPDNGASGIREQYIVEAPHQEGAESKAQSKCRRKHKQFAEYIVIQWSEETGSDSSSSSSSSVGSTASTMGAVYSLLTFDSRNNKAQWAEPGSVASGSYRNYHYRYGKKTGDWSGYEKCVKEEREMNQAVWKWCGIGFGSLVALAFWEITLPFAIVGGGGYLLHKKNQNKNRPAQVMNKYRKESIN